MLDLTIWSNSPRPLKQIANDLVTQLALLAGVTRSTLAVFYRRMETERATVTVVARTPVDASALLVAVQNDTSGADIARSNGILSATLAHDDGANGRGGSGQQQLSPGAVAGIVIGAVVFVLVLLAVVVLVAALAARWFLRTTPASTESMAELNNPQTSSNVLYSRDSL